MRVRAPVRRKREAIRSHLRSCHDADVIAEKPVLKWFKKAKSKAAPKKFQRLRKASKPFIDWLKKADGEESGEGEA